MALSGLDVALWDALAIAAGLPLATMLGGAPRPMRAYNSSGLGLMAPEAAADEAEQLLERRVSGRQAAARLSDARTRTCAVARAVRARVPRRHRRSWSTTTRR